MASNKLRNTASLEVPTRSRGFTPPSWSFFVSSHLSGSSSNSRTNSSTEGKEGAGGFFWGELMRFGSCRGSTLRNKDTHFWVVKQGNRAPRSRGRSSEKSD